MITLQSVTRENYNACLSHFSEKGTTGLHMQVHKDNRTAIHVYKKNG